MASIRLRPDQIKRLKITGNVRAVIAHAIMRYERGDFVIPKRQKKDKTKEVLQVVPLSRKFEKYTDWQIRMILDKHFAIKDAVLQADCDAKLAKVNKEIEQLMAIFCVKNGNEYRLEKDEEE